MCYLWKIFNIILAKNDHMIHKFIRYVLPITAVLIGIIFTVINKNSQYKISLEWAMILIIVGGLVAIILVVTEPKVKKNKDVKEEKGIRIKENINSPIIQHQNNYYTQSSSTKKEFNLKVVFDNLQEELVLNPIFTKKIKIYKNKNATSKGLQVSSIIENSIPKSLDLLRLNYALKSFDIVLENTGEEVIENWKLELLFEGECVKLIGAVGSGYLGLLPAMIEYNNKKQVVFKENEPLVQEDKKSFKLYIIPKGKEYRIPIKWQLYAKDYIPRPKGYLYLNIKPKYEEETNIIEVNSEEEMKEEEIIVVEKKSYEEDGFDSFDKMG